MPRAIPKAGVGVELPEDLSAEPLPLPPAAVVLRDVLREVVLFLAEVVLATDFTFTVALAAAEDEEAALA